MKRILLVALLLVSCLPLYKYAYSEDNLLALDTGFDKKKAVVPDKIIQKDETSDKAIKPEEQGAPDDSDKELEKMRSYRTLIQGKEKELDLIKLDLDKDNLLLKERQAQKEIRQIDKVLPQGIKKEVTSGGKDTAESLKEENIDPSDVKIQLLLIADSLKEGQLSIKNTIYSFKEGDTIASKLRVEKIEAQGITLKEPDGTVLKVNFMD